MSIVFMITFRALLAVIYKQQNLQLTNVSRNVNQLEGQCPTRRVKKHLS